MIRFILKKKLLLVYKMLKYRKEPIENTKRFKKGLQ